MVTKKSKMSNKSKKSNTSKKTNKSKKSTDKFQIVCKVQRGNHCEKYDEKKVYASVYSACYVAHMNSKLCERHANKVTKMVTAKITRMKEIDSKHIFRLAHDELKKLSEDAAYLYKHHKDIG